MGKITKHWKDLQPYEKEVLYRKIQKYQEEINNQHQRAKDA